ncbi:MAG: SMP-30/gluconolactonase/LRE family protein [Gammaproteobacteria bacterium]
MSELEAVWETRAVLGEGPMWSARENAVYWVDIKRPALHRLHLGPHREHDVCTTWPMPERIGWVIERRSVQSLVAGFKSGIAFIDVDAGTSEPLGGPEADVASNRMNDAKADAQGRIYAGTMDDAERKPTGKLYRLDPDRSLHVVDEDYIVSNGPAFSPDGRTIYSTDSARRTVYALDVSDDGSLTNKRVFIEFGHAHGFPDGMTVDAEGCLWIGHWSGWRLSRFDANGRLMRAIGMPVAKITSCTFAGKNLDRLFVTTASIGLDEAALEQQPLAGSLFEVDPGTTGLPTQAYAG